ncbi:restriction endonuclease subunit S [Helicobacter pylori]
MIGPLSSQLNAIKWGEFKLGDLFEASNGDFDIQKRHINHKGEFVITAGLSNNGVLGQSDIKAKVFESHTITIDMFGCAFYRSFPYKMVTHARVFSLKPKFEINHKIGLFLSTLFFGYPKKFGYENMCSWAKIKNDKVILPLKPTAKTQTIKDIDFNFMETFIAELEAYLKATGLSNTTLSNDEENALNVFNDKNSMGGNTPCGLTWQSFKLGDLFEVLPYKKRFDANKVNIYASKTKDTYPYVVRTSLNNGIRGYLKENTNFLNAGNTISFGQDTATMFYQEKPYFTGDKIKILRCKNPNFNKINALFFITSLTKAFRNFSWGSASFSVSIIENQNISLPTNQHGKIDFHFMHTLINALMKQTIQGVVQYSSTKIQATKEAISQETPTPKDSLF